MCVPILSHNSPTNNVLLQITVPKRTGGKRKRGSDGPFFYPSGEDVAPMAGSNISDAALRSQHGLDKPSVLFRKLRDNPDTYSIEAVGDIRQTHRYRGMGRCG
jgi:general transcription factor 3C polypeptide 5 (transcription factor C subunit 1)